jgi:XTP/dITP diphosphohydrolase
MRLVFASNNAHKLDEVRAIMPSGIEVLSLREIGFEQEIEENGATLEENSRIKAETVWEYVKGTKDNGHRWCVC